MSSIEEHEFKRRRWSERPGKRIVFEAGYGCQVLACICLFIAFVSGYWIQSWPRVYSGFRNIGLWEVCLSGLVLEADVTQKSYHGCWWLLSTEFRNIRSWVNPPWFVFTQVMVTLCMIAEIINIILMGILLIFSGLPKLGSKYKKNPLLPVQVGFGITAVTAGVMSLTVIVFGLAFWMDRRWLPQYYLNYPSWSFGMAVMSSILSVFATIAQALYVKIVRQEMREPPSSVPPTPETSFMYDVRRT